MPACFIVGCKTGYPSQKNNTDKKMSCL
uniref:Uncharacterized protein n=1 Tax=Strigamia maritima TaxID=126957 RepID=T1ITN4_STRMM